MLRTCDFRHRCDFWGLEDDQSRLGVQTPKTEIFGAWLAKIIDSSIQYNRPYINVAGDLNVGGAETTREVERFDEVALLSDELVELDDTRHIVTEGDNTDTHCIRVDVETER